MTKLNDLLLLAVDPAEEDHEQEMPGVEDEGARAAKSPRARRSASKARDAATKARDQEAELREEAERQRNQAEAM